MNDGCGKMNYFVIARERSDRSNLAQITRLLRLRLAMTASDFSIIVKNIAIFQQSLLVNWQNGQI